MLNSIAICGRIVRDIELKTAGSIYVCNFTVAVERNYRDKDGEKITDFIDCTAWRKTAEYAAKYCTKGRTVTVRGSLESRQWHDKDGNKRKEWYINADDVNGVDGKREDQQNNTYQGGYQTGVNYAAPSPAYAQTAIEPGAEYAVLTDDDGQLPF